MRHSLSGAPGWPRSCERCWAMTPWSKRPITMASRCCAKFSDSLSGRRGDEHADHPVSVVCRDCKGGTRTSVVGQFDCNGSARYSGANGTKFARHGPGRLRRWHRLLWVRRSVGIDPGAPHLLGEEFHQERMQWAKVG